MGQYHILVNIDKREFVDPWNLGHLAKQWEQIGNAFGMPHVMFLLMSCSNNRGGGDFVANNPEFRAYGDSPSPNLAAVLGRWVGDRIVILGDYTLDGDITGCPYKESHIWDMCYGEDDCYTQWTNISDIVRPVMERVCAVKIVDKPRTIRHLDGTYETHHSYYSVPWNWYSNEPETDAPKSYNVCMDMVLTPQEDGTVAIQTEVRNK